MARFIALRRNNKTPARAIEGAISFSSSSRFAINSGLKKVDPVTLPPGFARLATIPVATASP
jgi:hypothetical protein